VASSNIENADFTNIYNARINLVHRPAPADNTKQLAETYEAIQMQIKDLSSPDKKFKSPTKSETFV